MKLYKVTSLSAGEFSFHPLVSYGFGSRAAAEQFAAGLASSGQAQRASVSSYEVEDEDEEDEA